MSFADDVKRFAVKAEQVNEKVWRASLFNVFTNVVLGSPVDTGRFRNNWFLEPTAGTQTTNAKGKQGSAALSRISKALPALGESAVLYNNLPYAATIEYGGYPNPVKIGTYNKRTKSYEQRSEGGYSKLAPQGMVRISAREWPQIVEELARKNKI